MKKSLSLNNSNSDESNSILEESSLKNIAKCKRTFSLRDGKSSVKNGHSEPNEDLVCFDNDVKDISFIEALKEENNTSDISECFIEGFAILEFTSEDDLMKYVDSHTQKSEAKVEDTVRKSNRRRLRNLKLNTENGCCRVTNDQSVTDNSSTHSTRPGSRTSPDPYHFEEHESKEKRNLREIKSEVTASVSNNSDGFISAEHDLTDNLVTPKSPLRVVCPGDSCFSFGPASHQSMPPHVSPVTSLSPRVRPGALSNNGNSGPPTLKSEKVSPPPPRSMSEMKGCHSSPHQSSSSFANDEGEHNDTIRLKESSSPYPLSDRKPKSGFRSSQFSVASLAQSDSYSNHSSLSNPVTNPISSNASWAKRTPPVANHKRNSPPATTDSLTKIKSTTNQTKLNSRTKSPALSNGVGPRTATVPANQLSHSQSYLSQLSSANPFSIRAPSPAVSLATQQYPSAAWQHPFGPLPSGFTRKCGSPSNLSSAAGLTAGSHHPLIAGPEYYNRAGWENQFLAQTNAALLASATLPGPTANFLRPSASSAAMHGLPPGFTHPNSLLSQRGGLVPPPNSNDYPGAAALSVFREAGANSALHHQQREALDYMRNMVANGSVSGASNFMPGFVAAHARLTSAPSMQGANPHCVTPLNLSQPDLMGFIGANPGSSHAAHLVKPAAGKARRWCNMHVQIANYIHKCEKSKKCEDAVKQGCRSSLSNPIPRSSSQSSLPLSQVRVSSSDKSVSNSGGSSNSSMPPFHHNPPGAMFPPSYLLPQEFLSQATRPNLANHFLPGGLPLHMPPGMNHHPMWPPFGPLLDRERALHSHFSKFPGGLQAAHQNLTNPTNSGHNDISPTSTGGYSYHPSDPKKRRIMNPSQPSVSLTSTNPSSSRKISTNSHNNHHHNLHRSGNHSATNSSSNKRNGTPSNAPATTISPPLNLSKVVNSSKPTVSNSTEARNHSTAYHSVNALIDNGAAVRSDSASSSQRASSCSSNPLSVNVTDESANNLLLNGSSVGHAVSPSKSASNYESGAKYEIKT